MAPTPCQDPKEKSGVEGRRGLQRPAWTTSIPCACPRTTPPPSIPAGHVLRQDHIHHSDPAWPCDSTLSIKVRWGHRMDGTWGNAGYISLHLHWSDGGPVKLSKDGSSEDWRCFTVSCCRGNSWACFFLCFIPWLYWHLACKVKHGNMFAMPPKTWVHFTVIHVKPQSDSC